MGDEFFDAFRKTRLADQHGGIIRGVALTQGSVGVVFCHLDQQARKTLVNGERLAYLRQPLLRCHFLLRPQDAHGRLSGAGVVADGLRSDVPGIAFGEGERLMVWLVLGEL